MPTLPLFVHERHSTQAILETLHSHKASGTNLDLFGDAGLDIADKLDAYEHTGPWTNRLILGDSLQVMNSLLEYEGLGGQVQMLYIDPPYGVKFGSNFQPFVRKRDVTHGKDEEMIREPEMVKAYRDTWELGLHSYLSYLRDRLLLARELLTDSGSIFVQISDDNLHHVREVMDEVFGNSGFASLVSFRKTSSASGHGLSSVTDYLLWYCKDIAKLKFNQPYVVKRPGEAGSSQYTWVHYPDGRRENLGTAEKALDEAENNGGRIFRQDNLTSQRPASGSDLKSYTYQGKDFSPGKGTFKTDLKGMKSLDAANRLIRVGNTLAYVRFIDDFPVIPISNFWSDTGLSGFGADKLYVVQTSTKVIERCLLMTTDPGDLVMDITCGSGTSATVAEQWGRRWITCDTSRVPLALARQRLITATFPWYRLKDPARGPAGGFRYERKQNRKGEEVGGLVPRITLKSIANNEPPEMVTLVDRPEVDNKITRVCGAFTVEATIQAALTLEDDAPAADGKPGAMCVREVNPRAYLDRMIEVLRQSKTLRLPGNASLSLAQVRPLAGMEYLHAEAVASALAGMDAGEAPAEARIAIAFGPEDGAIGSDAVYNAHTEALQQGFQQLFLFGFAIQAKARELIDKLKLPTTYVSMTPDVVMSDLLKTNQASEIFSITGLPDVELQVSGPGEDGEPRYRVVVRGLDIFRPDRLAVESIEAGSLPCWMLDINYNGQVFCAAQVFFPRTAAWDNLKKSLKAEFNPGVWEHLAGTVSEPFTVGDKGRVAVKVIDERGNELMVVKSVA